MNVEVHNKVNNTETSHAARMAGIGFYWLCGTVICRGLDGRSLPVVPATAVVASCRLQFRPGRILLLMDILWCRGVCCSLRDRLFTHLFGSAVAAGVWLAHYRTPGTDCPITKYGLNS